MRYWPSKAGPALAGKESIAYAHGEPSYYRWIELALAALMDRADVTELHITVDEYDKFSTKFADGVSFRVAVGTDVGLKLTLKAGGK
jgi:hypothetical protein